MSKETLKDGRTIEGGPTNVRGGVTVTKAGIKTLKIKMYTEFLQAKQDGKIGLSYTFDEWLKSSVDTLRTLRKYDIDTEMNLGKISRAEHDALDEIRVKMITAIIQMDVSELDKYGVQYIDSTAAKIAAGSSASVLDNRLLIPTHRKDVIKFKPDAKKIIK
jgi:hypothetical protein